MFNFSANFNCEIPLAFPQKNIDKRIVLPYNISSTLRWSREVIKDCKIQAAFAVLFLRYQFAFLGGSNFFLEVLK